MAFLLSDWIPKLVMKTTKSREFKVLRLGAIDIGSNAIRLLIVETTPKGGSLEVLSKRFNLRLGNESFSGGEFSAATAQAFIDVFKEIRALLSFYHVDHFSAFATSALREVRNAAPLLNQVRVDFQIPIQVISGEREARLVLEAVRPHIQPTADCVLMDLGGGSLEIVHVQQSRLKSFATLPLGAVRALRYYQESPEALSQHLTQMIESNAKKLRNFSQNKNPKKSLIGTGGNIRALNKLANRLIPGKIQKSHLTRDQLCIVLDALSEVSAKQREIQFELSPDRADVILPAAHVLYEFMFYFGFKSIFVPKVSLKHGIIAELVKSKS